MEILIKAVQLLLSLSILVLVHEFGHFIAAKIFKTRVEKFYLFFDPWFSLFKFKKGETEYGVGWLPLGGYVKISGMIDESMDKEQMKLPAQSYEFRAKPSWQRLIIMLGGVTVNIILAILIYILMLTIWGEKYLPTSQVNKYGIEVDSTGMQMGLASGDRILSVDNEVIEDFHKIPKKIILDKSKTIQILRQDEKIDVTIPDGFLAKLLKENSTSFISFRTPFIAAKFPDNSNAMKGGMKVGDQIIAVNEIQTPYYEEFRKQIVKFKDKKINLLVLRGADTVMLAVQVSKEGIIGVFNRSFEQYFDLSQKDYNFFEAIPAGTVKAYVGIGDYLKSLKLLFAPEVKAYENVGGFIRIGDLFPGIWDWEAFWRLTAFLSIMLAILNILPIPALDGGHVLFLLYEMVTRRKPSDKFLEYAQIVGMVLLFGLLIFANGNDIIRLFRH
jgi:regulator of sigma E protease